MKKYDYKNSTLGKRVRLLRQFLQEKCAPGVQIGKIKPLYSQLLTPPVVLYLHEIEAVQDLQVQIHFGRRPDQDVGAAPSEDHSSQLGE